MSSPLFEPVLPIELFVPSLFVPSLFVPSLVVL
jgi:hypothetical protein